MKRIARILTAGRIPAGEPAYEHVHAAYRLIGEVRRRVERKRRVRAYVDGAVVWLVILASLAAFWVLSVLL